MTKHQSSQRAPAKSTEPMVRLGEAARLAGVTDNQLQYYLYMGVAAASATTDAGQRRFSPAAIKRIRMIKLLNESGYPLREIREIFMLGSISGRQNNRR